MFPKYPYREYILKLNGISSSKKWSVSALSSPSKQHKFRTYKLGRDEWLGERPRSNLPFWLLMQRKPLRPRGRRSPCEVRCPGAASSSVWVTMAAWGRDQCLPMSETWMISISLQSFCAILSKLQKGQKQNTAEGWGMPELVLCSS